MSRGCRGFGHAARRRLDRRTWRQKHSSTFGNACMLLGSLGRHVLVWDGALGQLASHLKKAQTHHKQVRELFPLRLPDFDCIDPSFGTAGQRKNIYDYICSILVVLNFLFGVKDNCRFSMAYSKPQQEAVSHVMECAFRFCRRLATLDDNLWSEGYGLNHFEQSGGSKWPQLVASQVDDLSSAAGFDPSQFLDAEINDLLQNPSRLFKFSDRGPGINCKFTAGDRSEYIELVIRHLRSRKIGLTTQALSGGSVFAVRKSGGLLREVWDGSVLSSLTERPPKPPGLASPSMFKYLEASAAAPLRMSKRDGRCLFDQELLPVPLRRYMGRPSVLRAELLAAGLSVDELGTFLEDVEDDGSAVLFPISRVWGMGFSWSSFVSQVAVMGLCSRAGLPPDSLLAPDRKAPVDSALSYCVATDDVVILSNDSEGTTVTWARGLDNTFQQHGVLKNESKDLNDVTCGVAVGIELVDGLNWQPPVQGVFRLLCAVLDLLDVGTASPGSLWSILGSLQWYDLLVRCKLAVYNVSYDFVRQNPKWMKRAVPAEVQIEFLCSAILGAFWIVDCTAPYLGMFFTSDASSFGFGGAFAKCTLDQVRELARLDEKSGDHVGLGDGSSAHGHRLGKRLRLPLKQSDFHTAFSIRAKHKEHINVMEGHAHLRMLSWVLRSPARFGKRVVFGLDSKVWLGAVAKGRSSSPALLPICRRMAALLLASGIVPHYVFLYSEENPSDLPSRGRILRPLLRRTQKPRKITSVEKLFLKRKRAFQRLRDCGTCDFSSSQSSISSSSSCGSL